MPIKGGKIKKVSLKEFVVFLIIILYDLSVVKLLNFVACYVDFNAQW